MKSSRNAHLNSCSSSFFCDFYSDLKKNLEENPKGIIVEISKGIFGEIHGVNSAEISSRIQSGIPLRIPLDMSAGVPKNSPPWILSLFPSGIPQRSFIFIF